MTSPGARKTCPTSWHPYLPPGAVETPGVGHRMTGYRYSTFTSQLLTQRAESDTRCENPIRRDPTTFSRAAVAAAMATRA